MKLLIPLLIVPLNLKYNPEALKDCSPPSENVLHIGVFFFNDIKAQLLKSGLRQPKTNLVWQICFQIYPATLQPPKQMADSRAVSRLFASVFFTESGEREK